MDNKYLDVIIAPIITEKSESNRLDNKYSFKVKKDANKTEIKNAIEKIFKVKVTDVNTINVRSKAKSLGRYKGKVPAYKKAVVTLKEGNTIDFD